MDDLVASWEVPLSDGIHKIDFEHGTTTGKRAIYIDGKELLRRDWMFKLVGFEAFRVGKAKCLIKIDPVGGFAYGYSLEVNGKSYQKFTEAQSKIMKTWVLELSNQQYRVVLEKDTLDVWANGQRLVTEGVFVDEGSETHFMLGDHPAHIRASSSGNRREGIIHNLIVDDQVIPEAAE
ncbi:Hypothetical predicted protein [Cloeon dipterum]|uniref:Fas apoptotic inhibitory molecule 1 n=1 Tax=Cloeon dipterum TaxID=197152 RepID=A0A8S1BWG1_9INSE|nr:Hypothetical predicted protein [Cloeon dipterum]